MERVAVDFWRWPRRESSADIRSDFGQASNPESFRGQKRRNPPGASHSSISMVSHEFSRLLFHRCFPGKLRRSSAHLEASDGSDDKRRFSERAVCLEGYRWRYSDDDLVLSNTRIAAAIRSELSLSIPRFERALHYADGSGRAKRKAKRATHHWRFANKCRHRACFTQLAVTRLWRAKLCDAGLAELAPPKTSRAGQHRPQSFQGSQIDFVDPVGRGQLDFWVIEFRSEPLFETHVTWRRVGATNIASNNLGGLA
jgi:hypothetical protein